MPDTSEVRTMTDLNEYLGQKRPAFRALKEAAAKPDYAPTPLRARVTAEGRSGIRRIRIRDFQVLSDSPPSFVGYDIGPSSPELALDGRQVVAQQIEKFLNRKCGGCAQRSPFSSGNW